MLSRKAGEGGPFLALAPSATSNWLASDEAALGPEITLQCRGVTLAEHRRRRQGGGMEGKRGDGWGGVDTLIETGKGNEGEEGRETLLGNVTASSHHLLSASSNTCHRTPTHVFLPSFLSLHAYTFPLSSLSLGYSLHISVVKSARIYNYADTVANVT